MSAIINAGAQKINADTAGLTSSEPEAPTAQGPQFSEIMTGIGSEYGGLSHLFGDGMPKGSGTTDTSVTIPSDSVRGRLGGLVPALGSILQSGPAGTAQAVHDGDNDAGTPDNTLPGQVAADVKGKTTSTAFARLRSSLGF